MTFRVKRIYEPYGKEDGMRILVDRIWPQGISRFDAKIDLWNKEVAPTSELRKWFGHRPERWKEFQRRYRAEMARNPAIGALRKLGREQVVTLLYSARDVEHNQALVLAATLRRGAKPRRSEPAQLSSPACFAHEADPTYMGYLSRAETIAILNELLEAERAGARATLKFAQQARDTATKTLMETLHIRGIKWCAVLLSTVHKLGGEPSRKAGNFYNRALAVAGPRNRLAFLLRDQETLVKKLREAVPKIGDDGLHHDLSAMLKAHEGNIHLITAAAPAESTREQTRTRRRAAR
jgi:uncharacterized protein YeaO (DUF488 family)